MNKQKSFFGHSDVVRLSDEDATTELVEGAGEGFMGSSPRLSSEKWSRSPVRRLARSKLAKAIGKLKTVRPDGNLVRTASALGIRFGD
jgi:hypothetical protein